MPRLAGLLLCFFYTITASAQLYEVSEGTINFHSNAPQELIHARSKELRGVIDLSRKTFAFRIRMITFQGFNSPLQREHFNENYMESARYPEATFSGKIIEDADLAKDGEYDVRAKGKFNVHGLEQERIINAHVTLKKGIMSIASDFSVMLADHDIKIPRVVYDKLAPEIKVSLSASLKPRL